LPFIVLADLWVCARSDDNPKLSGKIWASLLLSYGLAGMLWFTLRARAVGSAVPAGSPVGWGTTLLTVPKLLLFDLYRMVFPVGLSPHYDLRLVQAVGAQFYLPFVLMVLLAGVLAFVAKRHPSNLIAAAWLLFPLLPTLNLRWLNQDDFAHDRYLYMSLFGAATLLSSAYIALRKKLPNARLLPFLGGLLVIAMAFAAAIQSQYWANDVHLFWRAVTVAPRNEWAHLNYGSALSARGRFTEAAAQFVESYQLRPSWQAAEYAGYSYRQVGDLARAEHWFKTATEANPELATAWFGLAQIRLEQHQPEQAVVLLKKALLLQPDADGYHYALGAALEQLSRPAEALDEYETELRLHPYQTGARAAIQRLEAQLARTPK
jgi:tetratricopeptide (TPR) repeat protein